MTILYAPDWQIRIGGVWKTLDKPTSTFLEAGFCQASAQVVLIPGVTTSAPKDVFNVDKMEVAGMPVRRSDNCFTSTKSEYWDDIANRWVKMDPYAQSLIRYALMMGRENTVIYGVGWTFGKAYDISLKALTKTDRTTGKVFHLSISNMSAVIDTSQPLTWLTPSSTPLDLCGPSMPYHCCITDAPPTETGEKVIKISATDSDEEIMRLLMSGSA